MLHFEELLIPLGDTTSAFTSRRKQGIRHQSIYYSLNMQMCETEDSINLFTRNLVSFVIFEGGHPMKECLIILFPDTAMYRVEY